MDPETTWRMLVLDIIALARGDEERLDDAVEGLRNLADWLDMGGFPPVISTEADR